MANSWKPKKLKGLQPLKPFKPLQPIKPIGAYKPPKFNDPFKDPFGDFKEPKEPKVKVMHVITEYEKEVLRILAPAINNRQLVKFYYSDISKDNNDWRIVEPHLIGQLKTTGNIILSAWFLPNQQQVMYGEEQKWGNYILGNIKIETIEIQSQTYSCTRPLYNCNDKRMSSIFCRTPQSLGW